MGLTQVSTDGVKDGSLLNADINASAAIAGSKISPDFGSQAISTTGGLSINGATVFNESGADVDFRIEGDTESNLFYVDAGNDRIGMGTPSPQYSLQIHKGDSSASVIQITNSTTGSGNTDGFQFGVDSSEQAFFNMRENKPIIFELNGSERMRIDSSGDVGIGDSAPSCKLAIKDVAEHTAYASVTPSVTASMLQLYNNPPNETANDHATIQFGVNGGSHNRVNSISAVAESAGNRKLAFTFCTDEAGSRAEKMRITGDGNVGIGTTSPSHKLHVVSSGTDTAFFKGRFVRIDGAAASDSPRLNLSLDGTDKASILLNRTDSSLSIETSTSAPMVFQTNNSERMRILSGGEVAIGGSGYSGQPFSVQTSGSSVGYLQSTGTTRATLGFADANSNVNVGFGAIGNNHVFLKDGSEKMRIDSSGTLFLGKTSQSSGTGGVELYADGPNFMTRNASGGSVLGLNDQNSTTGDALKIYYSDVLRGSLVYNGSSFFAYTASDYRLKENDTPISDGITRVKQLRPVKYNWKTDATKTYDGFIAHEVQAVVPDCVVGEKDAEVDSRGEGYQRLAVAGLVPVLTAALKEAIAKIETLETKVAALEAA